MQELKATEKAVTDGDLKIIEKYSPDAKSGIAVDPRLLGGPLGRNAKMMMLLPAFMVNKMKMKMDDKSIWIAVRIGLCNAYDLLYAIEGVHHYFQLACDTSVKPQEIRLPLFR